jgi:xanthine dehydrogenase YagT iron-sulfur-binding subunit
MIASNPIAKSGDRMSEIHAKRRDLLAIAASGALAGHVTGAATPASAATRPPAAPPTLNVNLHINGRSIAVAIEPRTTLLDVLREQLALTGTKKGCDQGSCGACTVHLDGRAVVSCLTLAARCTDKKITTIEGLAHGDQLHPMQAAFAAHDALQCGYCTPGQIMSAVALIQSGHASSDAEIREFMSGNICRCGAYPNIVAAIKDAAPAIRRV